MNNSVILEFPALPCNEGFARMVAAGFVMDFNPTIEELSEIKTAVSEAVTNAIIHGYRNQPGTVILKADSEENTVTFTIRDNGVGIDNINRAMEPLYTGAPEMERSGMGFTIMKEFMDNLTVESEKGKGTTVILTKKISGGAENNGQ